jgi:hypothetical protein
VTEYPPPLFDHALNQDELNRQLIWKRQRNQRAQWRARQQAQLAGNPMAAAALQHKVQPLVDHVNDMQLAPMPADPDSQPPSNQDLNS